MREHCPAVVWKSAGPLAVTLLERISVVLALACNSMLPGQAHSREMEEDSDKLYNNGTSYVTKRRGLGCAYAWFSTLGVL